jgi:hypothetical protein
MPCSDGQCNDGQYNFSEERYELTTEKNKLTILLCAVCKILTKDQLKEIQPQGYNLLHWYCEHLLEDLSNKDPSASLKASTSLKAIYEFRRLDIRSYVCGDNTFYIEELYKNYET